MKKSILCAAAAAMLLVSACGTAKTDSNTTAADQITPAAAEATTAATEAEKTTETEEVIFDLEGGSTEEGSDKETESEEEEMTIEPWLMNTGSWTLNDDETEAYLPEKAKEAFETALEGYTGMNFTPIALLGTQVVAGTNYMYLCRGTAVVPNAEPALKVVIIYRDLEGNASITRVTDFDLTQVYEQALSEEEVAIVGGWTVSSDYMVANLPADVETAMADATANETEKTYENLAFLGSKVVAGVEYAVLTHTTSGDTQAIEVTFVCAGVDGTTVIVESLPLDLASYNTAAEE